MIGDHTIQALLQAPESPVSGQHDGAGYTARIEIPHHRKHVARHYAELLPRGLDAACEEAEIPFGFAHFGLVIEFDGPAELELYDDNNVITDDLRAAIDRFGPVIIRNAHLNSTVRSGGQRNIFQDLRFHVDRGANQPN